MSVAVEKSLLSGLRKAPKAAGPIVRTGVTRGGRVGVEIEHQGVKGWGVNHEAAKMSWQQAHANRYASGTTVGKAFSRQSVKPLLARKLPIAATAARPVRTNARAVIGKGAVGDALKFVKTGRSVAAAGWKAGRTGAKPRMALGTAVNAAHSPAMQRIGQAGQMAGQRPVITGLVGGSVLGGLVDHEAHQVGKAYGDPEDARYYRLGAGSAGLAAAGVGGLGYAVRESVPATKTARRGAAFGTRKGKGGLPLMIELHDRKNNKIKAEVLNQHRVHVADRLHRGGIATTRRGAAAGLAGLAALGGAEALRRRANERRWN